MARTPLRLAAAATLAVLFVGSTATAVSASEGVTHPAPVEGTPGHYIVVMKGDPLATYSGDVKGLSATEPAEGEQLDATTPDAQDYISHLEQKQDALAEDTGVTPDNTYQVTLNGFSADLTGAQVDELRASKEVLDVFPDEMRHPTAESSTSFLGLGDDRKGKGGVWQDLGGVKDAGKGIVVGVIDTGIAPENASFAGDKLKKQKTSKKHEKHRGKNKDPYTDGEYVYFEKSDGGTFKSAIVEGQDWDASAYSTKLIGGQYFFAGAQANGFDFQYDYLSPRDGDGHGSHTASTAAGNFKVKASVDGVDFGTISGVAPAAKVAMYKACYVGPDPLVTTDDICALSDLVAAIDQAVADGVDVINYSIGGGSATSILEPDDIAFLNAAAAGVFVSVSAGNDGPDPVTADHASPWYTTVAASTIPTWEGTVEFDGFAQAGASVSVPFGEEVSGPSIFAGDAGIADGANLCLPDTLDPAKVEGRIVVCERGENARVEKSQVVADAGGIGVVLVNVPGGADSLDNDFHAVPTVHLASAFHDAVLTYVQGGTDRVITLVGENTTDEVTPTPQIAGFSSRGPMKADGSDVIKPDIAAPGVAILAAGHNAKGEKPTYEILSGTSMASPHIAGLGALYLGEHPKAAPAEIKSAMMTTAYDTVNADGSANTDPFQQGAGQVDAEKYFAPGLLYLNGTADWLAYIEGTGRAEFDGVEPIDGSDLNLASIAIGTLATEQTVTRTVTATKAGTYTASASIPGVDVTVSPSTLTFRKAGETQTFTVTFDNASAPVEEWATGSLTWTSKEKKHKKPTTVRSPLAVFPVTADAPAEVAASGVDGSATVELTPGLNGELALNLSGLAPFSLLVDEDNPVDAHSGDENSGDANKDVSWIVDVPEGTTLSRFDLDSSDDTGSDLDLTVYRVVSPTDLRYYQRWQSATGSADERVSVQDPVAGTYLVVANIYSTSAPMTWDMTYANVLPAGSGGFAATPNPLAVTRGVDTSYELSWSGLDAGTRYLGVVQYGDSDVRSVVTVDTE